MLTFVFVLLSIFFFFFLCRTMQYIMCFSYMGGPYKRNSSLPVTPHKGFLFVHFARGVQSMLSMAEDAPWVK